MKFTGRGYRNDDIPESRTLSRRIGGRTHRVSKKRASRQFVTSANAIPLLIVPAIYATLNLFEDELTELSRKFIFFRKLIFSVELLYILIYIFFYCEKH